MKFLLQTTALATVLLVAAGCATPTPEALKPADVPQAFTAPIQQNAPVWPQVNWWQSFGSTEMAGLITTAQTDNLDLAAATAQVLQAEANSEIAGSSLFPNLSLGANADRNGSKKSSTIITPPTTGGTGTTFFGGGTSNSFGVTLNASYQLDLFGKARDNLEAAEETVKSAQYAQQTVALTVVGDVADTYMAVLALRERIAIARQNLDAASRILSITQAKVDNGVSSNLELSQQKALVSGVKAEIAPLQEQEREARYALAVLLGRPPEGFDVTAQNLNGIDGPAVQPGIPSELLERRPDVSESLADLASAHANVNAARAAYFPQIGLTGSGGFESAMLGTLFKSQSFVWSIGASLLQTVFDGGLLEGQSDLAKAQEMQLVANYRKAVLNAFSNTETALGQVYSFADQEKNLADEVAAAQEAFRISELQYREGTTDLLAVLQAQQTLFSAQDQLVQSKLAHLQAEISLYNALGGGWTEADNPDTTATVGKHPDNYLLPILPF
jgi:NodT family efflux transporter outer membrane factor (OMF) lipoprotein